jgi:hypothetical protein
MAQSGPNPITAVMSANDPLRNFDRFAFSWQVPLNSVSGPRPYRRSNDARVLGLLVFSSAMVLCAASPSLVLGGIDMQLAP